MLFFLHALFITADAQPKKTILNYYNSIPENLLNNNRYELQLINNKWIVGYGTPLEFEAIVDIKNGYINITDNGTGGGTAIQEMALYRTASGRDIIGVNLTNFDGVGYECIIKFYRTDGQWLDVTGDVLPKIDLFLFMDGSYKVHERQVNWFKDFTKGIVLLYQLPRTGTTMNVEVNMDRFIMENRKNDNNLKSGAYEIIKSIKYRGIKLIWDKKNNKFNPGEITSFVPYSDLEKQYIHISYKGAIHPQQRDDPERKAVLDALRKRWPNSDVVFVVKYFKANDGWAWIHVLPQSRDGKNRYEDELWLLQKINGQWKTVEARGSGPECIEDPDCDDDKKFYKKLKSKYPSATADIFP